MFTDTITQGYKGSSGSVTSVAKTYTGDGVVEYEGDILAGATNVQIVIAVDVSAMKCMLLYATEPVTVKTNSSSSPGDTITLAKGQSIVWGNDYTAPAPFSVDVTSLYLTNAGTAKSSFKFRALLDVTPAV